MPFGEEHSATLLVEVDGTPLPADVAPLLVSGYVDSARSVPDVFVLRFSDEHGTVLAKGKFTIGAKVKLQVQASGPGGPKPLLEAEVTAVEAEVDAEGVHTTVRGYDVSHRLFRGRRVEAYRKMTGGEIARKVAQRAGLAVGSVPSGGAQVEHVMQDDVDDWTFLASLAEQHGWVLRVVDGKLDLAEPGKAAQAPSGGDEARKNPLVLEKGVNLQWLRATVTAAGQVPEVEVRSWDVQAKKALVAKVPAATVSAQLADADPAKLAKTFQGPLLVQPAPGLETQAAVQARAKALADRLAGGFAELEGAAHGNPAMKAGEAVAVRGLGSPFDGRYVLTAVRHDFDAEHGYVTSFTVAGASERSLLGTVLGTSGGAFSSGGGPTGRTPTLGVLTAIVTDAKDPLGLGRVRLQFPVHSDQYESGWARVVQLGAGASRGTGLLPEVGDEVLVAFSEGDLGQPYVLGGLYNGKDKPEPDQVGGTDGKIQRRVFVSRTGMRVEHLEKPGGEELVLSTNGGAQKIRLVQKPDASIEIVSEGPVTVTAKKEVQVTAQKDVSVTTQTGAVTVKGADVTLEGSKSVVVKSPKLTLEGTATTEVKGASVKVAATGTAELSASGVTTVRGSLVKIN
ncbi:VgrG-related protein [Cellulomonas fimi]|uniref:Rhs element Vgr protein n=1 Tax=Cellulomonas fimi (strain ATCC 484 / DSM 20113 / JCM 1341 / CCUG 24087 / LMG 16345 / NBRC 15513 / NCIMB 8980 / NCTC 7547 / NRS-133) TaxID=590998 RepID=F4H5I4_CELFA|nr:VgrG-related protein [Cellulomonas fimi]AEE44308.1 Rhs element Vgr protein [Cellulomonas fimi ATCC 484]NNH09150.1 VgrG-related protein [Cellulomonas fimi]VEH26092.1 Phage protein D [Cellulomonas fimi]